jgi:hypothetical protein
MEKSQKVIFIDRKEHRISMLSFQACIVRSSTPYAQWPQIDQAIGSGELTPVEWIPTGKHGRV